MSDDAWPAHDPAQGPLPRVEDLPVAPQGYDQEAVREAFDAFYRHAAQLDVSLRALESVDAFRRDADALRNDIRSLRAIGVGHGTAEPAWAMQTYERARSDASGVALRLAAESALIVAVAVIAGVAHLRTSVIVALMAGAFVVVAFSEWIASRSRFVPPAVAFTAAPMPAPVAAVVAAPPGAPDWGVVAAEPEPGEDTEPEALTIVAPPETNGDVPAVAAAPDPWEQGPTVDTEPEAQSAAGSAAEPAAESAADPEAAVRGGLFRRRR